MKKQLLPNQRFGNMYLFKYKVNNYLNIKFTCRNYFVNKTELQGQNCCKLRKANNSHSRR